MATGITTFTMELLMESNPLKIQGLPTSVESAQSTLLEAVELLKVGKLFEAHCKTRLAMSYISLAHNTTDRPKEVWSK